MDQDKILNQLKDLLASTGGKYNILEEQINVELQVEFFDWIKKIMDEKRNSDDILADEKILYDPENTIEKQKKILVELSNTESVEAYRIIERFIDSKNKDLNQWAVLALQHSRIGLETQLLDDQQVFISTGLGGKGEKLRYFIVCKFKEKLNITDIQKKVAQTEFEVSFKNYDCILEKFSFYDNCFSVLGLIPIEVSTNEVIKSAIDESNNYGGFIYDKYLMTNIKELQECEIEKYFKEIGI